MRTKQIVALLERIEALVREALPTVQAHDAGDVKQLVSKYPSHVPMGLPLPKDDR